MHNYNKLVPDYISDLVVDFSNNSVYNLRSGTNCGLQIPKQRTKYMINSFTNLSAHIWNNITVSFMFKPSLN